MITFLTINSLMNQKEEKPHIDFIFNDLTTNQWSFYRLNKKKYIFINVGVLRALKLTTT